VVVVFQEWLTESVLPVTTAHVQVSYGQGVCGREVKHTTN